MSDIDRLTDDDLELARRLLREIIGAVEGRRDNRFIGFNARRALEVLTPKPEPEKK